MDRQAEIDEAIEWAEALPVLGDSPKVKLLAEEVKRLLDIIESVRTNFGMIVSIAKRGKEECQTQ